MNARPLGTRPPLGGLCLSLAAVAAADARATLPAASAASAASASLASFAPALAGVAVVALSVLGCGGATLGPTGETRGGQPVIALGGCCVTSDPVSPLPPLFVASDDRVGRCTTTVDIDGSAWPAGHRDDVYYTGRQPPENVRTLPAAWHFDAAAAAEPIEVDLAARFPGVREAVFPVFDSEPSGDKLTSKGEVEALTFLSDRYGTSAKIRRLGEGGFSIAFVVCAAPQPCFVAKVRKLPPTWAAWKRDHLAVRAAEQLVRDMSLYVVADRLTALGRFVTPAGEPVPLRVDGAPVQPPDAPAGPPGRLARALGFTRAVRLADGLVEQPLIAFVPGAELAAVFADLDRADSRALAQASAEAGAVGGVTPGQVRRFLADHARPGSIGPEVARIVAFLHGCQDLAQIPTVSRLCALARRDFLLTDDFLDRVRALEQLYRDSAGAVMRFSRANFKRAMGNIGADQGIREVGLDFNHGRNVGWDPRTGQMVLFDW